MQWKRVVLFVGVIGVSSLLYLFLVTHPRISALGYDLEPYINNFPQTQTTSGVDLTQSKIYLGDRIRIHVEIFNPSLRVLSNVTVRLTARGLKLIEPREESSGPLNYEASIDRLPALSRRSISVVVMAFTAGQVFVEVELNNFPSSKAERNMRRLKLQIEPRPTSDEPLVPADIVSHLGDQASRECQQQFPCKERTKNGCREYPDSEEAQRCLAERNRDLFSGCDNFKGKDLTDWYMCLMRKHGFSTSF